MSVKPGLEEFKIVVIVESILLDLVLQSINPSKEAVRMKC